MKRLDQKVALITGGASGIGKAIASRFVADGARVIITDVQIELGQATAAECGCLFLEQDVCDEMRWGKVIEEVEALCGRLDILVNNAGIGGPVDVTLERARLADWKEIFAINVEGVFLGCREAIAPMRRAGGGSIINMSSIAGFLATPAFVAYGASKAAVRHMTQSVAQYCAEQKLNIRCNSVHPGNVLTPLWHRYAEQAAEAHGVPVEEIIAKARERSPLGDFTRPMDIAAAVSFLSSDDARRITGERLVVDGGHISCNSYEPPRTGSMGALRS